MPIEQRRHRPVLPLLTIAICASLAVGGCRSAAPRAGGAAKLQHPSDVAVNREQLRLRMRALIGPMTGRIESTANEIAAASTEPAVRQAALEWKIDAVPAMREALFQPDPSMALMDAWVLLYQMIDYFDHGPGKTRLGDASPVAEAACRTLEEQLTGVAASATVSGDVSKARDVVRRWAGDHPLTGTVAAREPVLSVAFRDELAGTLTVGESAAEIAITLDDLNRKIEVYSGQLLRQARWEVERQRDELIDELPIKEAMPLADRAVGSAEQLAAAIDRLAPSVEGAADSVARAPDVIAAERRAAVEMFAAESRLVTEFAQRERLSVLEYLTAERKATLEDLRKAIAGEQHALASEADRLSVRVVDQAMDRIERLVAIALAVLIGGSLAGVLLIRLLFFHRTSTHRRLMAPM
jgi:hypothetical protein